jgi:hypothetical protein
LAHFLVVAAVHRAEVEEPPGGLRGGPGFFDGGVEGVLDLLPPQGGGVHRLLGVTGVTGHIRLREEQCGFVSETVEGPGLQLTYRGGRCLQGLNLLLLGEVFVGTPNGLPGTDRGFTSGPDLVNDGGMSSRFLLLVHADPAGWEGLDEEAAAEAIRDRAAAIERLRNEGVLIACSPLVEPAAGRRVVVRGGQVQVTPAAVDDAPLAGFYLVQADDGRHAERLAASIPDAASAQMTVRELMPLPGIPGVIPDPVESSRDRG